MWQYCCGDIDGAPRKKKKKLNSAAACFRRYSFHHSLDSISFMWSFVFEKNYKPNSTTKEILFLCVWMNLIYQKKKFFFSNRISLCRAEKRVGLATHNNFEIGNSIQYFYMFFELPASPASTVIFHLFSSFCFCFVRKTIMLWISIEVYRSFITYCQTFFSGVPHTINADTRVHFSVIDETHNGNDEWIIWF